MAGSIVLDAQGEWTLAMSHWTRTHGRVPPGTVITIPGSDRARIEYIPDPTTMRIESLNPVPVAHIPSITVAVDFADKPSYLSTDEVMDACRRAVRVWEEFLVNEELSMVIQFFFDTTAPSSALAGAFVVSDLHFWNTVYNTIALGYGGTDTDGAEQTVYNWLPATSNIPFRWEGSPTPVGTTRIRMSKPLAGALFGNPIDTAYIGINPNLGAKEKWDAQPADGIASNTYDLVGVLVHEIGHHFGFMSNVGDLGSPQSVSMLDVFRFQQSDQPSQTITASQMMGTARQLTVNAPAASGLAINNPNAVFPMSRSGPTPSEDEYQASHWDEPAVGLLEHPHLSRSVYPQCLKQLAASLAVT